MNCSFHVSKLQNSKLLVHIYNNCLDVHKKISKKQTILNEYLLSHIVI